MLLKLLSIKGNTAAAVESYRAVRDRRSLLVAMAWREVADRYAGQALGIGWAVATPLLTMATYVFAFAFIFKGRLGPQDSGAGYIAYVLCGLACWMAISEALTRSATAITGNSSLVKQIVFPNEILPLKVVLATLPSFLIGLIVTAIASGIAGSLPVSALVLLPIAVFFYILLLAGFGFIVASLGVFVRDIRDIVAFFTSIGMFLHPILYAPASTPHWLEPIFMMSPFSHMIWCFRDALVGGSTDQHLYSWVVYPAVSILVFVIGWRLFRMMRPMFGNAL